MGQCHLGDDLIVGQWPCSWPGGPMLWVSVVVPLPPFGG